MIRTKVFKRKPRQRRKVMVDGSVKTYDLKGGHFYRIEYKYPGMYKAKTIEAGPFGLRIVRAKMKEKAATLERSHGKEHEAEKMTFDRLADTMELLHYREAVIVNGKKVEGVRSLVSVRAQIGNLRRFFGKSLIQDLTPAALLDYRRHRMRTRTIDGKEVPGVKIATVNRELAAMRRMMNHAVGQGWIIRDIFRGSGAIQIGAEEPRKRILNKDEERRLLAACEESWEQPYVRRRNGKDEALRGHYTPNPRLKALLVLAIDTGCRRGELLKLQWTDIDFDLGVINVLAENTKVERPRQVPLSARAKVELKTLKTNFPHERPFPFSDVKRMFAKAKELAGLDDLRFHDLRRSAGDRMSQRYPLATTAQILGHTQLKTTLKHYTGAETSVVLQVRDWLDETDRTDPITTPNEPANEMVN